MTLNTDLEKACIDTIRTLAMDAVQKANSGHPGTPMALAPVLYTIWAKHLRHDPAFPDLPNRDRFILSIGHASMLLYGTLHLSGYDLSLDDIKNFRVLGSPCAGHPEYRHCPGVEITTGPLGQGFASAVGMAIAERKMANHFNRPGHELMSHQVIALGGDGDMMEGVSMEAASLAGHLGLDNLVWVYDANEITIEGTTEIAFTEDVAMRMKAMGWEVSYVPDANDVPALEAALGATRNGGGKPHFIIVRSHIAFGSPNKQDTPDAHGAPLGDEEIAATKKAYGLDSSKTFFVPAQAKSAFSEHCRNRGKALSDSWKQSLAAYQEAHPAEGEELNAFLTGGLPTGWDEDLPVFAADAKGMAGRAASGEALNAIAAKVPWLMGGSADLGPSNKTTIVGAESFSSNNPGGRNIHFGVREHAMGAMVNGMTLAGMRAYSGTFFVFSDYMRPIHRSAGLMGIPAIYVYTHDSIGVGEDGPTHQPIEHLASLRAIPNLDVIRPGDANEVTQAWRYAMSQNERPCALVLSRQNHETLDRRVYQGAEGVHRGAYVLNKDEEKPEVILIGSGTELAIAVEAAKILSGDGIKARVVSMPCWEQFARQDAAYRESVLPTACEARVSIEAGATFGWERHVGIKGQAIGIDHYGASAPASVLFEHFGLTKEAVVSAAKAQIEGLV